MRLSGWKAFLHGLLVASRRSRRTRQGSRRMHSPRPAWVCETLESRTMLSVDSLSALVDGNPASEVAVAGGASFDFDLLYESEGEAETTNGEDTVTVRLHFDSSAIAFDSLSNGLTGGDIAVDPALASVSVESDAGDLDGDSTTDSFVAVTFTSQSELPSPATLFTASFTAMAGQNAGTPINLTGAVDAGDSLETSPLTVNIDSTPPQAVLSGPADPVGMGEFDVSLEFGEDVSGFDAQSDLVVVNADVTNVSGSNGSFTITVRPIAGGTVTIDVAADVAQDAAGNGNLAATQYAVTAVEQDFGDAPDSYGTSLPDGPRHFPEGPTLGELRDTETDAQTPLDATGDDATNTVTESILAAPIVTLQTNFGPLSIQLDPDAAPQTVANFLQYVADGDYEDSIFHRLMDGFVLQGGGFTTNSEFFADISQFTPVPTDNPVQNEFNRSNLRGTISMAKLGGDPDSATSQFFFNLDDNSGNLDNQNGGFTVFGDLIDLTLLDELAAIATQDEGGAFTNLPVANDDRLIVVRFAGVASAAGTVFDDANGNGQRDGGEAGIANVTVFADINNDGDLDADDLVATTDADGGYIIDGLPLGDVVIRQIPPASSLQSRPFPADGYTLTISVGSQFENVDFGVVAAIDADPFIPDGDEDGVRISEDFRVITGTTETATVTIQNSNGEARLYAWIDFNGNGSFDDAGEQIADGTGDFADLGDGEVTVPFDVPTGITGTTFARFRVSTDAELGIGGEASDGEVEDYALSIEDPDTTPPQPTISGPASPTSGNAFDVTIDFGEVVGGFDATDVVVGNGSVTEIAGGGDGAFTVTISVAADGEVTIDAPADAAVDRSGNSSLAATQFAVTVDATPPQPTLSGPQMSNQATFDVTIDFGETVVGFTTTDISVGNGSVDDLTGGTDGVFTATITATSDGTVNVSIVGGVATDEAGNANLPSTQLSVPVDTTGPVPTISGLPSSTEPVFVVTIDFAETVTGFEESDITVDNGMVQSISSQTNGRFTVTIQSTVDGAVTINVPAGGANDDFGNPSEAAEPFTVSVDTEPAVKRTAVGIGPGGTPQVRVFDPDSGIEIFNFLAYDAAFRGGVRVAVGDVTGDGVEDIVTGAGVGGGPHIKVFNGQTGDEVRSFFAYDAAFTGGVSVAAGDVNNDGFADIITGAGAGGGPHVKVFSGLDGAVLQEFFAYSPAFNGGVNVAAGDIDRDGFADVITGAGEGGGPHVKVFDGDSQAVVRSFLAYSAAFSGGVWVAAGDVNGDGLADIVTGAGPGGGPHVLVFSSATGAVIQDFFAFNPAFSVGVQVAAVDVNDDGLADIITGAGAGGGPHVITFEGLSTEILRNEFPFDEVFSGGVFVG